MKRISIAVLCVVCAAVSAFAAYPDAPNINTPSAYNAKIFLSWQAEPSGYDSYQIYRSTGTGFGKLAETTASSYMDDPAYNGRLHLYRISGKKNNAESALSVTVSAIPFAEPYMPGPVSITVKSGMNISFTWGTSMTAGTYPVASYSIKRATYQQNMPDAGSVTYNSFSDTVALSGFRYYYSINAVDIMGNSSSARLFSEFFDGVLPAPLGLTVTSYTGYAASLSWIASDSASAGLTYEIYRDDALYGTVSSPFFYDTQGGAGISVKYEVLALNSYGSSPKSAPVYLTFSAAAPLGLTITPAAPGQLDISWQALASQENAAGYEIFRATESGGYDLAYPYAVTFTAPYADAAALTGNVYFYSVRAVTASARVADEVSYRSVSFAPEVTGLAAAAGYGAVKLSFDEAHESYGVNAYRIYRSTDDTNFSLISQATQGQYNDSGLNTYSAYYYSVTAVNYYSESTRSASVMSFASGLLDAPSDLSVTAKPEGTIYLSWGASPGASSYNVYRTTVPGYYGAAYAPNLTATQYTDSLVNTYTQYCYKVNAASTTISAFTPEACAYAVTVPEPPTNIIGTATSGGVVLSWDAPNTLNAYAYEVYRSTAAAMFNQSLYTPLAAGLTVSAYTDATALTGNSYYYEIKTNLNGIRDNSGQTLLVSVPGIPGPPVKLIGIAGDSQAILLWQKDVINPPDYYAVYRRQSTDSDYGPPVANLYNFDEKEHVDSGLTNGVTYVYAVAAVNGFGEGPKSSEITVTPYVSSILPPDPALRGSVINKKDIALNWDAAASGTYPVAGYVVLRSNDKGFKYSTLTITAQADTQYTDYSTEWGNYYTYMVRVADSQGNTDTAYTLYNVHLELPGNKVRVFSNLVNLSKGENLKLRWFSVKPGRLKLSVHTLSGVFVKTLAETEVPADASKTNPYESDDIIWDGKNASGSTVASGAYLLIMESGNERVSAKFALIK